MKSKKIIVLLAVLAVFCLVAFALYNKVQKNQQAKDAYSSVPAFQVADLQENTVTEKSLSPEKSTLFLFFDPDCGNCEEEFLQIKAKRDSFLNCQMFFVSTLPKDAILSFLQKIDFRATENMCFLCDTREELSIAMNIRSMPSAVIYNKNRKLIKHYSGQVKTETLIKYLSE
jgi:protein-disulfide isomerase